MEVQRMYEDLIQEVDKNAIYVDIRQLGVWPSAPAATTLTSEGDVVIGLPTKGNPSIIEDLKLHEIGHSIFGHLKTLNKNDRASKMIKQSIAALPEDFQDKYDVDFKALSDEIAKSALNIVQDFEVNSKLLLEKKEEMDKDQLTAGGMWPENYKLENGKNWKEYLVDIISNFEEFIDNWIKHLEELPPSPFGQPNGMKIKGLDSDGEPVEADENEGEEREKKHLTGEELEEIIKKAAEVLGKEMDDIPANEELDVEGTEDKPHSANPEHVIVDSDGSITVSNECQFNKALEKLFRKRNEYTRATKSDTLYNMKRGLGDIVKPVYRRDRTLTKVVSNYVLLIDVSGSVSPMLISQFLKGYKNVMKKYNCEASVVTYSSRIVEEHKDLNKVDSLMIGGNTAGIVAVDYAKKNYSGKRVIIVSDFMDDTLEYLKDYKKNFKSMDALNWGGEGRVEDAVLDPHEVFDSIINVESMGDKG